MTTIAFNFDDLLVTCCREIIKNGLSSDKIPSTIRDWLAGRILTALPAPLVNKLVKLLLEQREISEFICLKEVKSGSDLLGLGFEELLGFLARKSLLVAELSQKFFLPSIRPTNPLVLQTQKI